MTPATRSSEGGDVSAGSSGCGRTQVWRPTAACSACGAAFPDSTFRQIAARGGPTVGSLRRRRVRDASGHVADANHRRFVWLWEPSHLVEIEAVHVASGVTWPVSTIWKCAMTPATRSSEGGDVSAGSSGCGRTQVWRPTAACSACGAAFPDSTFRQIAARGGPTVGSLRRRRVRDASGHVADANRWRIVWLWAVSYGVEIEAVTSHQV